MDLDVIHHVILRLGLSIPRFGKRDSTDCPGSPRDVPVSTSLALRSRECLTTLAFCSYMWSAEIKFISLLSHLSRPRVL